MLLKGLNFIKSLVLDNPVLLKEIRIGLREKKVFIIQVIYLLLIGLVAFLFLISMAGRTYYYDLAEVGRIYFLWLCIVQWFVLVLVAPSFTSSALSSEKEKQTYDLLITSLLSPLEIMWGKLGYALSYIILLLFSSLPLVSLVFFMGSVSPEDMALSYLTLFLWGVMACMAGLFFSSRESQSSRSTLATYGLLIFLGFFIVPNYMEYIEYNGHIFFYSKDWNEMLVWILIYIDIVAIFIFILFKIMNNIRAKSFYIQSIHRLFIWGFLLNFMGLAYMVYEEYINTGIDLEREGLSIIWAVYLMGALFFMGFFIEKRIFLSKGEEEKFNKSLTSNVMFFPRYFLGVGLFLSGVVSLLLSQYWMESLLSFFFLYLFMMVMTIMTNALFQVFREKARKVYIYFPILLLIGLLPYISLQVRGYSVGWDYPLTDSVYSFTFIQPVYNIQAIWSRGPCVMVKVGNMEVPGVFLTVFFYLAVSLVLLCLTHFMEKYREKRKEEEKEKKLHATAKSGEEGAKVNKPEERGE